MNIQDVAQKVADAANAWQMMEFEEKNESWHEGLQLQDLAEAFANRKFSGQ